VNMANESEDRAIAEFTKNSRETVRVRLQEFKGHKLLQLRSWAKTKDGTEIPTKSGIALQVSLIGDLRDALDKAELAAREMGWLP